MGCVCAVWMDALKKCTVEDKMREAVGRTNGRSVAGARGSGARARRGKARMGGGVRRPGCVM